MTGAEHIAGLPALGPATQVMTPEGEVPVEWLATGDRVLTRDQGSQPILWIGRTRVHRNDLAEMPGLAPIEIAERALGHGCPTHPTWLGPGNRVLLSGAMVELHLGLDEALARAGDLVDGCTVCTRPCEATQYTQILLPVHALVQANGLWVETLHLDNATVRALAGDLPAELLSDAELRVRHSLSCRPYAEDWEVLAIRGRRTGPVAELIRQIA